MSYTCFSLFCPLQVISKKLIHTNRTKKSEKRVAHKISKLVRKEYKARHDWVGKLIYREMCKKFKFDHANKSYMHNPAPVLENDTHKLLWDFDIQTDPLISARRPDLIIINKKKRKSTKLSTLPSRLTTE